MLNKQIKFMTLNADNQVFHFFCNSEKRYEKLVRAIFTIKGIAQQVANELMENFEDQIRVIGRTELVTEINISISDVNYPDGHYPIRKNSDINMDFYTEYVIRRDKRAATGGLDQLHGFVSPLTLGRFSRKQKKFYDISDGMLSKIEIL